MSKYYAMIWNFGEDFYRMTGLSVYAPIEFFFPDFGPWLFGKMIGVKGIKIKDTK